MKIFLCAAAILVLAVASAFADCTGDKLAPLSLTVTGKRVEVAGGTPKGRVLLVGYGRAWNADHYAMEFKRVRAFLPADEAGIFATEREDAVDYIWGAIDVESGRCGTTVASTDAVHQSRIPQSALKADGGKYTGIDIALPFAYVVLVRPQVGAWELTTADGGALDDDQKRDGRTSLVFDHLQVVGRSGEPPVELSENDVILVFSPQAQSIAFTRVENLP